ncbi:MAG: hypothetical protein ACOCQ5_04810 [Halanaerobiales bacterium]
MINVGIIGGGEGGVSILKTLMSVDEVNFIEGQNENSTKRDHE